MEKSAVAASVPPAAEASTSAQGAGRVLLVLGSAQFLMTLDSSVMNVSMAQVASDLGTTITGIQTAVTAYTLVMATLMIPGGKVGATIGRLRAFRLGLVIYAAGSLTTALAPNLSVLLLGWALLEGIGAALILPAIVALVAGNVPPERRTQAYGLIAAAGAMAVAAGPLIGGAVTTYASWRYVFAGEVLLVAVILLRQRRLTDVPPTPTPLDLVGALLTIASLGLIVLSVLKSSEWGWVAPKPGGPSILGASPVVWGLVSGFVLLSVLLRWEQRLVRLGREPLVPPDLLQVPQLTAGLAVFFGQFTIQAGVFFALPLFLSVVLELDAVQTGARVFPLSVALLVVAVGVPKRWPKASPRRVVRLGLVAVLVGVLMLVGGMEPGADAAVVALPLLLIGGGLGALSSQLGGVTVSAVPDSRSPEVGGLQNTVTNLGASLGTALVGSVLLATLATSVVAGLESNPDVPAEVSGRAAVELTSGVPFLSDTQLEAALDDAGVPATTAEAVMDVNHEARFEALRTAFALVALLTAGTLVLAGRLPEEPPGRPADQPPAPGEATAARRRDPRDGDEEGTRATDHLPDPPRGAHPG